uniref:Uncharacterized protein n=1 Tax=Anguilla anguilla TaxID=7936 RepID=A0A0E9X6Y9_ANGAN
MSSQREWLNWQHALMKPFRWLTYSHSLSNRLTPPFCKSQNINGAIFMRR